MSYVILGNDSICRFFDNKKTKKNLWCQIDFLIICNFFWFNHFLIRCQTKVLLYWIHVSLGPKWKNLGSGVPILVGSTASHPTYYNLPYWKVHCCPDFLFFEIETSNFGYLLIFIFANCAKFLQDWTTSKNQFSNSPILQFTNLKYCIKGKEPFKTSF